jgi:hypothetical protein
MKLKAFNSENSKCVTEKTPHIRLNLHGGLITLNSGCRDLAKLKAGVIIEFYQNEESPKDWYFGISDKGFKLRAKDKADTFTFNSSLTVKSILKSAGLTDVRGVSFPVSSAEIIEDGKKLYLIVTGKPLNKK